MAMRFLLTSLLFFKLASAGDGPVVRTTLGQVQGTTLGIPDHETQAYGFLNVPFAASPVDHLRFQPPQPRKPWDGVRDATKLGPPCPHTVEFMQGMIEQSFKATKAEVLPYSEDCLHLNVYTPSLTGSRPVMVFIHGGGLWGGMASAYDMRVHAILEDIVGVVIQYRLGALGWLSTGDDVVPGNMGFQDQVAALQWVQDNIVHFGGDPNQVTIFGESAGSWSVSMHVLSPLSAGLFHRAIMQSGSVQDSHFFSPPVNVKSNAQKLASLLGCPTSDSEELVKCLQGKPVKDTFEPEGQFDVDSIFNIIHVPRVDGKCFPDHPSQLLSKGRFNNVDIIAGVTEVEGYGLAGFFTPGYADQEDFNQTQFKTTVKLLMQTRYPENPEYLEALGEAALELCGTGPQDSVLKRCLAEFAGDHMIASSTYKTVKDLVDRDNKGKIYFYEFKHRREHSSLPEYITADHGDDLAFTFGSSYTKNLFGGTVSDYNRDHKIVEGVVLKYWTNFARTGNPNSEGLPKWPEFKENESYLVISTNPSVEQKYQPRRMKYWTETVPAITQGARDGPVVTTTLGKVQGTTLSIPDHETQAYAFLNVPFVASPVGDLRFQPPQPRKPWDGVRDATKLGPPCPHSIEFMQEIWEQSFKTTNTEVLPYSEDCLHLNIYTSSLTGSRPVMVFIHGGGLWGGMASTYDMRVHAIREGIVGVVIQYRLGALGWLSTGDDVVPGNMGFQDQVAALQWVQDNIARFGGDPNQVTIFGESAGSWSVSMHVLSPLSAGLFHRAIMQSGSVQDHYFFSPPVNVKSKAQQLANLLGCPTSDSEELVKCLKGKPVKYMFEPEGQLNIDLLIDLTHVPRVDGKCFPDHPSQLLSTGRFNHVDIIVGVTEVEGYGLAGFFAPGYADQEDFNQTQFKTAAKLLMQTQYPKNADYLEALGEAALELCEPGAQDGVLKRCLAELAGDHIVASSTYKTAKALMENSKKKIYFYEFKHRREHSSLPEYITADHGDDLPFTFGSSYTNNLFGGTVSDYNRDDKIVEGVVLKYWTTFARTGNPNGDGLAKWPEFKENESYLVISTNPSVEHKYQPRRMKYWTETVPTITQGTRDGPVVRTTLGKVQGTTLGIPDHETQAYAFLNVPFVAPPVGDLRFQPPQPRKPWDGVRDATKLGPPCPHLVELMQQAWEQSLKTTKAEVLPYSEDCLHLNIYTPSLTGRRPVMVFIHGGGLWGGMASTYDMRVHAIREDIVGVVIQYRLGALGWLSTGDDVVPGNMGFQDQVAALQWVQDNIAGFGGDPNQVTIFGESAGSSSVSMHVLSPLSTGLFHRAIMQSGSVQDHSSFSPPVNVKSKAQLLAGLLGCPTSDSEELVKCMKGKPVKYILEPEGQLNIDLLIDLIHVPRVDGKCFPDHPSQLLSTGRFNHVDIIVGVTEVEGYGLAGFFAPGFFYQEDFNETQFKTAAKLLMQTYTKNADYLEALGEAALELCEPGAQDGALKRCLAELAGDHIVASSTYKTAKALMENSKKKVYFYEFKHRREHSSLPEYITADHGDDLPFTFGSSYTNKLIGGTVSDYNRDDKIVEGVVLKYWTTFARTGNPNGDGLAKWPEFKENESYLVISTNPSIEQKYQPRRMKFWTETVPSITKEKLEERNEL